MRRTGVSMEKGGLAGLIGPEPPPFPPNGGHRGRCEGDNPARATTVRGQGEGRDEARDGAGEGGTGRETGAGEGRGEPGPQPSSLPRLRRRISRGARPAEEGARRVDDEALAQRLAADEHPEAHLVAVAQGRLGRAPAGRRAEVEQHDDALLACGPRSCAPRGGRAPAHSTAPRRRLGVLPRVHPEAHARSPRRSSSMSKAWREELRAPVSILALIHGTPMPGRLTHSRQPTDGALSGSALSVSARPSRWLDGSATPPSSQDTR